ncbi:MAG: hypothetical protein ACRDPE_07695 [Solirubrobacterales bacterium]
MNGSLTAALPCVGVKNNTLTAVEVSLDGWCPEVKEMAADGATYAYRVTPMAATGPTQVVASGAANGVSRRVSVGLNAATVGSVLADEGLIGQEWISTVGNVENIKVSMGTNGNVESNGNVQICGDIRHGVGKRWITNGNVKQCAGYQETEGNETLPEVSTFMPADIATNNSDGRLEKCMSLSPKSPASCQSDGFNGSVGQIWSKSPLTLSPPHAPSISLAGNNVLTLGGGDYWLCGLSFSGNAELIIADGAQVRVFFDTPQSCGLAAGATQISFSGNNVLKASGYQPEKGRYDMPGFYLLGNGAVNLAGNAGTNDLIIYGPKAAISLVGNANYKGAIAGNTLTMTGNGTFSQDPGFEPPQIGGSRLFARQSYQECAGGTAVSEPAENC